jgi:TPP-dependent trihydroxycyclohexane-1,2-dione (THcHDO) dehydratase
MNETLTLPEKPGIAKGGTVRLTTAQALVRYLSGLRTRIEGPQGNEIVPLFGGVFAIFGHGNVAGLGRRCISTATGYLPIGRITNRPWPMQRLPTRRRISGDG